jgi:hypothetical protein
MSTRIPGYEVYKDPKTNKIKVEDLPWEAVLRRLNFGMDPLDLPKGYARSWRAPVNNAAQLPITGNGLGDIRLVILEQKLYCCPDGTSTWVAISGSGSGGPSNTLAVTEAGDNLYLTPARRALIITEAVNEANALADDAVAASLAAANAYTDAAIAAINIDADVENLIAVAKAEAIADAALDATSKADDAVTTANDYTDAKILAETTLILQAAAIDAQNRADAALAAALAAIAAVNVTVSDQDILDALGFTPEDVANKGVANGYVPLGGDSKIPSQYLPNITPLTKVTVVADQAARLALPSVNEGDAAKQTDDGTLWLFAGGDSTDANDWVSAVPDNSVVTVNGMTGPVVSLETTHIPEGSNLYYTNGRTDARIDLKFPPIAVNNSFKRRGVVATGATVLSYEAIPVASGSVQGELSVADWIRFDAAATSSASFTTITSNASKRRTVVNANQTALAYEVIPVANGSTQGELSAADWTRFDAAASASSPTANASKRRAVVASNATSVTYEVIPVASGLTQGELLAVDWTKFSNTTTAMGLSATGTLTSNASKRRAVVASNATVASYEAIPVASGSVQGELSAADWTRFDAASASVAPTSKITGITFSSNVAVFANVPGWVAIPAADADALEIDFLVSRQSKRAFVKVLVYFDGSTVAVSQQQAEAGGDIGIEFGAAVSSGTLILQYKSDNTGAFNASKCSIRKIKI